MNEKKMKKEETPTNICKNTVSQFHVFTLKNEFQYV